MVTFNDILDAFNEYKRHECKQTWDVLWLASNECMARLIKTSIKGKCVSDDDLSDMINGAVCSIMERFRAAVFADLPWIESRFHLQRMSALNVQIREQKNLNKEICIDDVQIAVNILQKPCQ